MSHFKFWAKLLDTENDREPNPWWLPPSDGLGKSRLILPLVSVWKMKYPQCVQDSIMIFWPLDLWVDSRDDVDLLDLRSTWSRLRVKVSNGQKIMIEYKKLWGCLICNTRMWIIDGKMNKRFPRPSDGCNHHGLGSQSFSVSNNFAQNPRCDAFFDRVRHRKVLT